MSSSLKALKMPYFPNMSYIVSKLYGLHQATSSLVNANCRLFLVTTHYKRGTIDKNTVKQEKIPWDMTFGTGGLSKFCGRRLISWQCKKQTIVATSQLRPSMFLLASLLVDNTAARSNSLAASFFFVPLYPADRFGVCWLSYGFAGSLFFQLDEWFSCWMYYGSELIRFYAANTSIHAARLVCAGSIMFLLLLADLVLLGSSLFLLCIHMILLVGWPLPLSLGFLFQPGSSHFLLCINVSAS
ncbi:hypothetical protein Tco_0939615 [Tanacetum coccineum]|uniref:Uncharacterized protein n=1 Tax=Tanacetum coccineum TaxID=301880 RepID=A0ABQ5DKN5_9ASTR